MAERKFLNFFPKGKRYFSRYFFHLTVVKILIEDNGTPLQYSCLENPMDGGVW